MQSRRRQRLQHSSRWRQFDQALHSARSAPKKRRTRTAAASLIETDVNKVEVSREVATQPADLDVLNLRARVDEVVAMIKAANESR